MYLIDQRHKLFNEPKKTNYLSIYEIGWSSSIIQCIQESKPKTKFKNNQLIQFSSN